MLDLKKVSSVDFGKNYNFEPPSGNYRGLPWRVEEMEDGQKVMILGKSGEEFDFTPNPFDDYYYDSEYQEKPWSSIPVDIIKTEGKIKCSGDASGLFKHIEAKKIDLSGFDTSNVSRMASMFEYCDFLRELNISSFNTENVEDMQAMFKHCEQLSELDLTNFKTPNLKQMDYMFSDCYNLIGVNLSSFDTSNVEWMQGMFNDCRRLKVLDLSNFNTSKVKFMNNMFDGCKSLRELDLSNFDTSGVKTMQFMFSSCVFLEKLDISNFSVKNGADISYVVYDCPSLHDVSYTDNRLKEDIEEAYSVFNRFIPSYHLDAVKSLDIPDEDFGAYVMVGFLNAKDMSRFAVVLPRNQYDEDGVQFDEVEKCIVRDAKLGTHYEGVLDLKKRVLGLIHDNEEVLEQNEELYYKIPEVSDDLLDYSDEYYELMD